MFTLSSELTCNIDRRENRGASLLTVQYPFYSFPKRKHGALDLVFDLSCNFHTDYPQKSGFLTANPTHGFCKISSKITLDHRHVEISRPSEYSTALESSQRQLSTKKIFQNTENKPRLQASTDTRHVLYHLILNENTHFPTSVG